MDNKPEQPESQKIVQNEIVEKKEDQKEDDNWLPLQSNPEVMNGLLHQLGMKTDQWAVQDLLSVQQWAQEMLGQPVLGIIFLYQINQIQRQYEKMQPTHKNNSIDNVFFMRQYANNACGTIALFHVIMNNLYDYDLVKEDSYFSKFASENFGKTATEIGQSFKLNKDICQKHKSSVKKGKTKIVQKVQTHFIAFIQKDGFLFELDGRKKEPTNHGQCSPQGLVFMSCLVIQQFMQRDPTNHNYTLLAIGQKPQL